MDNDYNNLDKDIAYVLNRINIDDSVMELIRKESKVSKRIEEIVSEIVKLTEEFCERMNDEEDFVLSYNNEQDYVVDMTDYSTEIVEIVLWFYECCKMNDNLIEHLAKCNKCDHTGLFPKEGDNGLFDIVFECGKCNQRFTWDEVYDVDDDNQIYIDFDERLPLQERMIIPLKDVSKTSTSYIFKAATGYRKAIWRKIQISTAATLDDLSIVVLDAFNFDYDHLYAFYMDQKLRTRRVPTYYSPRCGYTYDSADQVMLESFNFKPKDKFLFLYDFGDEWHFTMTFEKEIEEVTPKAFVIKSAKEPPSQYRFYDYDDEDFEE